MGIPGIPGIHGIPAYHQPGQHTFIQEDQDGRNIRPIIITMLGMNQIDIKY